MRRPVRTHFYRNPRFYDKAHQTIVFSTPVRAYTRVVHDMQEHDGHIFGWIRHRHGDLAVVKTDLDSLLESWAPTSLYSADEIRCGLPGAKQVQPRSMQMVQS